jgi:hypothetical protein
MVGVILRDSEHGDALSLSLSIMSLLLAVAIQICAIALIGMGWFPMTFSSSINRSEYFMKRCLVLLISLLAIVFAVRRSVVDNMCLPPSLSSIDYQFNRMINYTFCGNNIHSADLRALPVDAVLSLFVTPVLLAAAFPSIDVCWHWLNLTLSICTLVATKILSSKEMPPISVFFVMVCSAFYLITDLQVKQAQIFFEKMQRRNSAAMAVNSSLIKDSNISPTVIPILSRCLNGSNSNLDRRTDAHVDEVSVNAVSQSSRPSLQTMTMLFELSDEESLSSTDVASTKRIA